MTIVLRPSRQDGTEFVVSKNDECSSSSSSNAEEGISSSLIVQRSIIPLDGNNQKPIIIRWKKIRFFPLSSLVILAISSLLAFYTVSEIKDSVILNWTELRSSTEKMNILWDRMTSNLQSEPWIGLTEILIRGFYLQTDQTERLTKRNTFRPFTNKKKFLHTQGAHVKVKWHAVNNPLGYTGLLQEDDVDGFVTFSKGSRIVSNTSASWGMGLKLLRDNGPPAASVFCSPSTLFGQFTSFNWNMFDAPLCGHTDIFSGALLLSIARVRPRQGVNEALWTRFGNGPGISNFADLTKTNSTVPIPHFPFSICMKAPKKLAGKFAGQLPWYHPIEMLRHVPQNTLLYEVFAFDTPAMLPELYKVQQNAVKIAEIRTQSEFITSRWADNHWTYQHQKFEEDLQRRPDWMPHMNLATLIMDGYAYEPLYEGRTSQLGNIMQVIGYKFPTVLISIFRMMNPGSLFNLLDDDIGIIRLQKVLQSVTLGLPDAPNPNVDSSSSVRSRIRIDPALEHNIVKFLSKTLFPQINPWFVTKTSNTTLPIWEVPSSLNLDNTDFSLDPLTKSGEVTGKQINTIKQFEKDLEMNPLFDGHFLRPTGSMSALANFLSDPMSRDVAREITKPYLKMFGITFLDDLTKSIFESEDGVGDIQSFVRIALGTMEQDNADASSAAVEPIQDNTEPTSSRVLGSGAAAAAADSGVNEDFRRLLSRICGPLQRLGQIRPLG